MHKDFNMQKYLFRVVLNMALPMNYIFGFFFFNLRQGLAKLVRLVLNLKFLFALASSVAGVTGPVF